MFRASVGVGLAVLLVLAAGLFLVLHSKTLIFTHNATPTDPTTPEPFPISVNPATKSIEARPASDTSVADYAAPYLTYRSTERWFDRLTQRLGQYSWYQQLASANTRVLIILPGERREQITEHFAQILAWDQAERDVFLEQLRTTPPAFSDGTLLPGRYVLPVDTGPRAAHDHIRANFDSIVLARYPTEYETVVPLHTTLTIASLLEREAYDFTDMRIISGIIWNRLFIDMPLQIDATLQYARADSTPNTHTWWPIPRPADKFIDSSYNTYQNPGLPPGPIANPGVASIIAALNPTPTDCLFYVHDPQGRFHCSETYEEHVRNVTTYYGQGR